MTRFRKIFALIFMVIFGLLNAHDLFPHVHDDLVNDQSHTVSFSQFHHHSDDLSHHHSHDQESEEELHLLEKLFINHLQTEHRNSTKVLIPDGDKTAKKVNTSVLKDSESFHVTKKELSNLHFLTRLRNYIPKDWYLFEQSRRGPPAV